MHTYIPASCPDKSDLEYPCKEAHYFSSDKHAHQKQQNQRRNNCMTAITFVKALDNKIYNMLNSSTPFY